MNESYFINSYLLFVANSKVDEVISYFELPPGFSQQTVQNSNTTSVPSINQTIIQPPSTGGTTSGGY